MSAAPLAARVESRDGDRPRHACIAAPAKRLQYRDAIDGARSLSSTSAGWRYGYCRAARGMILMNNDANSHIRKISRSFMPARFTSAALQSAHAPCAYACFLLLRTANFPISARRRGFARLISFR